LTKRSWFIEEGALARLCVHEDGFTDVVLFKQYCDNHVKNHWIEIGKLCVVIESGRTFTDVLLDGMMGAVPTRQLEVIHEQDET
jgi:hypothetical protein